MVDSNKAEKRSINEIMLAAWKKGIVIPAFNIPYVPILEPIIRAMQDTQCFGMIAVARCEWEKFSAGSMRTIYDEYQRIKDERFTRLHLDHVPVIDEDGKRVAYEEIIADALSLGYESVMVDGSRLALDENIAATKKIVDMAHKKGIPVEAELGTVLGHEPGPLPSYEKLYNSGKGFTDIAQAGRFIEETACAWLSVAVGNIHGAISEVGKDEKKVNARINIEHLKKIKRVVSRPLVLHGGSGIQKESLQSAIKNGIAKINIGTTVRQAYEKLMNESVARAQDNVYNTVKYIISEELEIVGSAQIINQVLK